MLSISRSRISANQFGISIAQRTYVGTNKSCSSGEEGLDGRDILLLRCIAFILLHEALNITSNGRKGSGEYLSSVEVCWPSGWRLWVQPTCSGFAPLFDARTSLAVAKSTGCMYWVVLYMGMAGQFLSEHVAVKQVEGKTFRPRRSSSVTILKKDEWWGLIWNNTNSQSNDWVRSTVLLGPTLGLHALLPACVCQVSTWPSSWSRHQTYIGETKRTLKVRLGEHKQAVKRGDIPALWCHKGAVYIRPHHSSFFSIVTDKDLRGQNVLPSTCFTATCSLKNCPAIPLP